MKKKIVLYPITVPDSDYCWEYSGRSVCEFFSNEGGHETCGLHFRGQKRCEEGVKKAHECAKLKEKE